MPTPASLPPELIAEALAVARLGVWISEGSGSPFRISDNFHELIGRAADDLPVSEADWLTLAHPEERHELARLFAMQAGREAPTTLLFPLRLRCANGVWSWFSVTVRPTSQRLIATFSEVTHQKQTEAALRDSQLRYRALYATSPLAFILWNREGYITEWNHRAESMFGWPTDAVIGKKVHQLLLPPQQHDAFREAVSGLTQGQSDGHFTGPTRNRDGQTLYCTWYNVALRSPQGSLIGILSLVLDVTEKTRYEHELEAHRRNLEQLVQDRTNELAGAHDSLAQIIDNSPVPTFVLDAEHRISHWNMACATITGHPSGEMVGSRQQWQAFYPAARPVMADLVMTGEIELIQRYYEGKYRPSQAIPGAYEAEDYFPAFDRWLYIAAAPLHDAHGRVIGAIETLQDISERKHAERALLDAKSIAESAASAKAEFLANMSHEIRTPMNAVIGLAHLLQKTGLDRKQRDYVSRIKGAGEILMRLINDVLDFSKIEAGRMHIEHTEFSLDTMLNNVATVVMTRAQEKGLELQYVVDPEVPARLIGDPLRLTQILINLIGNAIKFTAQGSVTAFLRCPPTVSGGHVRLEVDVQDTGIGMTIEQQSRLFQAFTQADTSITRTYGGTGLGLTISKRLIELMGGRIWVTSQPGIGSTFSFEVNLDLPAREPVSDSEAHHPPGRRALVVDDNPLARSVLARLLEKVDCRVDVANSGREALALLERQGPGAFDYVTIDLNMPEMDGLELAAAIHNLFPESPRLILVTAADTQPMEEAGALADFDGTLNKPVTAAQIRDLLSAAPAATVPETPEPSPLAGLRILLAEDIPTNRLIAVELLEALGITVETADNGALALAAMRDHGERIDLVLMDMQMPEMDGLEATCRIRQSLPGRPELPIIAMTAHALEEERERCLAAGMNDFITKPVDPEILRATLLHWKPATLADAPLAAPTMTAPAPNPPPTPSPPAGTPPVADGMPVLPGIDTADGLRRMMNKPALYEKVLRDFHARFTNEAQFIRAALAANDLETAERHAHSSKGLSGSIGARELQASALALEVAIREQGGYPSSEMDAYEAALTTVIDGIGKAYGLART